MTVSQVLLASCGGLYALLGIVIVWRSRRIAPALLGACCLVTAGWAGVSLWVEGDGVYGLEILADLLRALAWFGFLLYLYHDAKLGKPGHVVGFLIAGLAAAAMGGIPGLMEPGPMTSRGLFMAAMSARIMLAVVELLLIENLYLNLPDQSRWHVALPAVLLGGLACFDITVSAEAVLFHRSSPALLGARTLGMIMIAPLLLTAAARGQRWRGRVRLSRTAAFHSATLVLSGGVLLALAAAGEVFRHVSESWGWLAEAALAFAAVIAIGLMLTTASARSRIQRLMVDHFFAERYDYRRQWLACIRTLSGEGGDLQTALPTRAIRAVASVVDSPAGALFVRDGEFGPFAWAGSWNLPAVDAIPPDHPAVAAVRDGSWIARLDDPAPHPAPLDGLGPLWLCVPLTHRGGLSGLVVVAPPRAPFVLEQEVFDLLRTVAQEVSLYIAEQSATQTLLQTRDLRDYSKRFAFVAHDIKNVSSQLALLVTNAQVHIANPEFQKDMIETVESSVRKITALLQRLERPEVDRAPGALAPAAKLEALVETYRRVRGAKLILEHDGSTGAVAMGAEAFETAATHLLNNAVEASPGTPVRVRVRHEARQVVIEVSDDGPGMTAEFVRDALFTPFSTSKDGGSGIGAFQSRELVREAGGELEVRTAPGRGTTMRMTLPRTDQPNRSMVAA